MAKKKTETPRLKKGFKRYPLIQPTMIGDKIQPIGYEIALTPEGYRFYKQKKII